MRLARHLLLIGASWVGVLGCSLLAPPDSETVGTRPPEASSGAAGSSVGDAGSSADAGTGGESTAPVDVGTPTGPWAIPDGTLLTAWGSNVRPDDALRDYPRPQLVRGAWATLNGLWDYALRSKVDAQPSTWDGKILVPFAIESALSGVGTPLTTQGQLWYRRSFDMPTAWRGQRLLLHFGAVDYVAHVFVNGEEVGDHQGGYDAFSFDVTERLRATKTQEVVVAVTDPSDGGGQPRGKQSASPKLGSLNQVSGIWQSVWLEPVPDAFLDGVDISQSAADGTVTVKAGLGGSSTSGATLSVTIREADATVVSRTGPAGAALTLKIPEPKLWSPASPTLYDLAITLSDESGVVDSVKSYVGLRDIAVRADEAGVSRIYLNDEPLFQLGVIDQGHWPDGLYTAPSDEAVRTDLSRAKQLGFVAVRKHQKIEPDRYYYWCDKLGLLVWQDMPAAKNATSSDRVQFEVELGALVAQHRNHPSIVAWNLFYFGGGQFEPARLTESVKTLDSSRLVNAITGFPDDGSGDVRDRPDFARPSSVAARERPAVLGAFGGLEQGVDGHVWNASQTFGYDAATAVPLATDRYQEWLASTWGLVAAPGLSAAMFRQLTDVEDELDGLFTYDRAQLKFDSKRLPPLNAGKLDPVYTLLETSDMTADPRVTPEGGASYGAERHRFRFTAIEQAGWEQPDFDDSSWTEAPAGFGSGKSGAPFVIGTPWTSGNIWIRTTFDYAGPTTGSVYARLLHAGDVWTYVNGVLATSTIDSSTEYQDLLMSGAAQSALGPGKVTLAARCINRGGGQFVDVGVVRRPEGATLLDPVEPRATQPGLIFARYEGTFDTMPDFRTLTPATLGEWATPTTAAAAPNTVTYALSFDGFVDVPRDGLYTFFVKADDKASLSIDGTQFVQVRNASVVEYSANIGLKAGKHALSLGYVQLDGPANVQLSWAGPGLAKQVVPASVLSHAVEQTVAAPSAQLGVAFAQYNGTFSALPDFAALTPNRTGVTSTLSTAASNLVNFYALKFTGYIDVPQAGVYSFLLSADDGAKLWLGDIVIDNDGQHAVTTVSGNVALTAGKHAFTLGYHQRSSLASLDLSWIGPGIAKQSVPASVLFR